MVAAAEERRICGCDYAQSSARYGEKTEHGDCNKRHGRAEDLALLAERGKNSAHTRFPRWSVFKFGEDRLHILLILDVSLFLLRHGAFTLLLKVKCQLAL